MEEEEAKWRLGEEGAVEEDSVVGGMIPFRWMRRSCMCLRRMKDLTKATHLSRESRACGEHGPGEWMERWGWMIPAMRDSASWCSGEEGRQWEEDEAGAEKEAGAGEEDSRDL
jgi:hypothetical protein